jgi:DNA-binding XRE family transcriptional regulator
MMQVFISWSGERSGALAGLLQNWLPKVLQAVRPWISSASIDAGTRWSPEVAQALQQIQFGIVCLTPENLREPWILFEAGALSKMVAETRVVPYLLGLEPRELDGPLAQFQAVRADKAGTKSLVHSLNSAASDRAITGEAVNETLEMWWPRLEADIQRLLLSPEVTEAPKPLRSTEDMLGEVLELLRGQRYVLSPEVDFIAQDNAALYGLGDRVRRLRLLRNLTQAEVAEKAGVSQSYISQLESGRFVPSAYLLRALAAALGVEPAELVQRSDNG